MFYAVHFIAGESLIRGCGKFCRAGISYIIVFGVNDILGLSLCLSMCGIASAMPEDGGFYVWVKRAMGPAWAFNCGWWMFISVLLDTSVYLVLALAYLEGMIGEFSLLTRWLIAFSIILACTYINIRGLKSLGFFSTVFSILILLPAVVLIILGFANWQHAPFTPFMAPEVLSSGGMALALSIGIWCFAGYEYIFTMAEEFEQPEKVLPKGLLIVLPLVTLTYILPMIAGLAGVGQWEEWSAEGGLSFVQMGAQLGGPVLGVILLFSIVISNVALYNTYVGSNGRVPFAMARDNLFPQFFTKTHPKYGTPYIAIIISAAVTAVLCLGSFETLIVADVFMFVSVLIFVFISGLILRIKEPELHRPYKVPVGTKGFAAIVVLLVAIALWTMFSSGIEYVIGGTIGLSTGPILYLILRITTRKRI